MYANAIQLGKCTCMNCTKQFAQVKWQSSEQTSWCGYCEMRHKLLFDHAYKQHCGMIVMFMHLTIRQRVRVVYEQIVDKASLFHKTNN